LYGYSSVIFNSISGKNLNIATLFQPGYLAFLVALPLIVGGDGRNLSRILFVII
jgi:hypothetical protein